MTNTAFNRSLLYSLRRQTLQILPGIQGDYRVPIFATQALITNVHQEKEVEKERE